jgi:tRNA G18 (ribose-2'-O)-methylase SpoU
METHSKQFFSRHEIEPLPKHISPIIIADSFSTPSNVGSIIRLGANMGALRVIVINGEHLRETKIKKTAGAAYSQIEVVFIEFDELQNYIPDDYVLSALETTGNAKSIFEPLPEKMALVLGNEKFGMSEKILMQCQEIRYIPMPGIIKSMNVSHAASVGLFEWYRQHQ